MAISYPPSVPPSTGEDGRGVASLLRNDALARHREARRAVAISLFRHTKKRSPRR